MSNSKLEQYVQSALFWDPRVDSAAITVHAKDGKIVLSGPVGSFREKLEATETVERVYGVTSVDNQLDVRLPPDKRRADAGIRRDVRQALMLNCRVPQSVDAAVENGIVTLTGSADWQYQRDEAESVASNVAGVVDLVDDITLKAPPNDVKRAA